MVDIGSVVGTATSGIGKSVSGTVVIIGKILPWLIVSLVFGFIFWKIFQDIILFKHRIKLKKIVGNSFQWVEDRAREKRLKNGAKVWYLKNLKVTKGLPPDDVLMINKRGKIVAEGYLINDNQIIWSKDTFSLKVVDEKVSAALIKEKAMLSKMSKGLELSPEDKLSVDEESLINFCDVHQPVSTNDRIVLGQVMADAEFGKKDMSKLLEKALPFAVIIILFIIFIFGFKFYAGPLSEYGQALLASAAPIAENNKLTAQYLYDIKNDIQTINADIKTLKQVQNVSGGK